MTPGNPSICGNPDCLCSDSSLGIPIRGGGNLFPRSQPGFRKASTEIRSVVRDIRDNRDPEEVGREILEQRAQERKVKANGHGMTMAERACTCHISGSYSCPIHEDD